MFCSQGKDSRTALFVIALLCFFTLLPGFADGQETPTPDDLLTSKIKNAILNDSRLPIDGISIFVLHGAVRLKGLVETLAQKNWIEEVIYRIPEAKVVDNQLAVIAQNYDDAALARVVQNQLVNSQNRLLDYSRVETSATEGIVVLKGDVKSYGAKLQAEEITAVVKGVRQIKNKLKVRDAKNNTDEKIKFAVEKALRAKIQMNRDFNLKISVIRGTVTIEGRLRSEREKSLAIRTTLFIPGTAEIIDKIEVLPE
jgi:osmotically-inducible protein OsmY